MTEILDIKTLAATKTWGRGRVYDSIAETIGHTPLVRLPNLMAAAKVKADVLLKLEFFNPLSSVKDRIGVSMIDALEAQGKITQAIKLRRSEQARTWMEKHIRDFKRGHELESLAA